MYRAEQYLNEHLNEFIDKYVQDELVVNKENNEIIFDDNVNDVELPNVNAPLEEGKLAVKKVKFDVNVVNKGNMETVNEVNVTVNRVGDNIHPDEYNPIDSLGKYVLVNNIKVSTGEDLLELDDVIENGTVNINEVGVDVNPVSIDPPGSEEAYIKMKDIKVTTNNLYNEFQYNRKYGEGLVNGYNNCANEVRVETLNTIDIKVKDYINDGNITVFPDNLKYVGKEYVKNINLDMTGLDDLHGNYIDKTVNVKEDCFLNGYPISNPYNIPKSNDVDGFKSVSLNLNGLSTNDSSNIVNNADVSIVTGRDDNWIKDNGQFIFQEHDNNYTGWNNFIVDVPKPDNLDFSDIRLNDDSYIKNGVIVKNGTFSIEQFNNRFEESWTGFGDFKVDVNYDGYVKKDDLYGYNSNPLVIDVNDYIMNKQENQIVDINNKDGVYGDPLINTDGVISIEESCIENVYYNNRERYDNQLVEDNQFVTYKNINLNNPNIENSIGYVQNNFENSDSQNKYFKKFYFKGRLLRVEVPTVEVLNNNNELLWSPYPDNNSPYVYFSNTDYDNWRYYSTNQNLLPFTGFSNIRYKIANIQIPRSIMHEYEEKSYDLRTYNNEQQDDYKLNGFNEVHFKLKNLNLNKRFLDGHAFYNDDNRTAIIRLTESEIQDGYRGFNNNLILNLIKNARLEIGIRKRIGLNQYRDRYGRANVTFENEKLKAEVNLDNTDIGILANDENTIGTQGINVDVDIPIMENIYKPTKYTSDGTYTFDIDDWNKLYGLSGSGNNYGNDFVGMKSFTFTVETGNELPSYDESNVYYGELNESNSYIDTIDGVQAIILKGDVVNPNPPVQVGSKNRDVVYYSGFAPGCYLPLPSKTLVNNVTYNEVDFNSGTNSGVEENTWNVAEGVINDGTDNHNINLNLRKLRDDGFTYPTLGGTLINNINLLSNYTKNVVGNTFRFNIDDFNRSNENTFNKDFLGIRSFNINFEGNGSINNADVDSLNNNIITTRNGTYNIPEGYTGWNSFSVNVPSDVNNDDIDSLNNNVITSRTGTYTIPQGYTGWNSFSINVPSDVNNYNGYDSNNKYLIQSTGNGIINIPSGYTGLGSIEYNVDVNTVDNADVDSLNNNVITTRVGTYNIPQGKTGWNSFSVNIPSDVNNADVDSNNLNVIEFNGEYVIPNGYSGWNSFEVDVQPNLITKTVNIDSIENNVINIYNPEEPIVPIMNSNNVDGFILTTDYYYNDNYDVFKMFDDNNNTYFSNHNSDYSVEHWFLIEFPNIINNIYKVYIYVSNDSSISFGLSISYSIDNNNYINIYNSNSNIEENTILNIDNFRNIDAKYIKFSYIGKTEIRTVQFYKKYDGFSLVTVNNNTYSKCGDPVQGGFNTNNQTVSVTTSNTTIYPYVKRGNITVPLESITVNYINGTIPVNIVSPSSGYYGIKNISYVGTDEQMTCSLLITNELAQSLSENNVRLGQTVFNMTNRSICDVGVFHFCTSFDNSVNIYKYLNVNDNIVLNFDTGNRYIYLWSETPFLFNKYYNIGDSSKIYIEVSNDGTSWTEIYNSAFWNHYVEFYNNVNKWRCYRIRFYGNWDYCHLKAMQFYYCANAEINNNNNVILEPTRTVNITSNELQYINPTTGYSGLTNLLIMPVVTELSLTLTLSNNRGYNYINCPNGFVGMSKVTVYITNDPQYYTSKFRIYEKTYNDSNFELLNETVRTSMVEIIQNNMWKVVVLEDNLEYATIGFNSNKILIVIRYISNDARVFIKVVNGIANGMSYISLQSGDVYAVIDKNNSGNSEYLLEHNYVENVVRFNVKTDFGFINGLYNELVSHELNDSHLNLDSNYENIVFNNSNNGEIDYGNPIYYNIPSGVNNYLGYDNSNPYVISSVGLGTINIPNGYTGLGNIYYNVTVPTVEPNLQSKTINYTIPYTPSTITADSGYDGLSLVNFNCTSSILNSLEYPSISLSSSDYDNLYYLNDNVDGLKISYNNNNNIVNDSDLYCCFDKIYDGNYINLDNGNSIIYEFNIPNIINGIKYKTMYYNGQNGFDIYACNDNINYILIYNDSIINDIVDVKSFLNQTIPFKFYKINFKSQGRLYELSLLYNVVTPNYQEPVILESNKQLTINSNDIGSNIYLNPSNGYDGITNAIINIPSLIGNVNNYTGYDSNNIYQILSIGRGTISIPNGYTGLGQIEYNVDVNTVNNANVNDQNNNIIEQNGTFTIPSGYTGWNNFTVSIPNIINNYNGYNSNDNNVYQINSNGSGIINIPEGYTGLGQIEYNVSVSNNYNNANVNISNNNMITSNGTFTIPSGYTGWNSFTVNIPRNIISSKKIAVKYGSTYTSSKYLISNMSSAGGSYHIPKYYGEGNYTQVFINTSTDEIISVASRGSSWDLYVPSSWKHGSLSFGNNDCDDYDFLLYDANDNVIFRHVNQISYSTSYSSLAISLSSYNVTFDTSYVDEEAVKNADVDLANNNVINNNGTYTIPQGYTGWNNFTVDVQSNINLQADKVYNVNGNQGQTIIATPDSGYNALEQVTFNVVAPSSQSKTVTPSNVQQVITPDSPYDYLSSVTVEGVNVSSGTVNLNRFVCVDERISTSNFNTLLNGNNITLQNNVIPCGSLIYYYNKNNKCYYGMLTFEYWGSETFSANTVLYNLSGVSIKYYFENRIMDGITCLGYNNNDVIDASFSSEGNEYSNEGNMYIYIGTDLNIDEVYPNNYLYGGGYDQFNSNFINIV